MRPRVPLRRRSGGAVPGRLPGLVRRVLGRCPGLVGGRLRRVPGGLLDLLRGAGHLLPYLLRRLGQRFAHLVDQVAGVLLHRLAGPPFQVGRRQQRGGQQPGAERDQAGRDRVALRLPYHRPRRLPRTVRHVRSLVRHTGGDVGCRTGRVTRRAHHLLAHATRPFLDPDPPPPGDPGGYRAVGQPVDVARQVRPGRLDLVPYPVGFFSHCASSFSVSTVCRGTGETARSRWRPVTYSTAPATAHTTATRRAAQPGSMTLLSPATTARVSTSATMYPAKPAAPS